MQKTVLVSGSSGFVGTNLCRRLIDRDYKVIALVRGDHHKQMLEEMGATRVVCQITDTDCLRDALKKADYVIDVIGKASDWGNYNSFLIPNVLGVKNLLEESMRADIKKFVHISSVAIHGFGNHVDTTEEGPFYKLDFPYCVTKREGENLVLDAYRKHSFPVTSIRPCNVYGVNDMGVIFKIAHALMNRSVPHVDGGKWLTSPVYVGNLADAIILAMEKDEAVGEAFIISDGLRITWREWDLKLCQALGVKGPWFSVPGFLARFIGASLEFFAKLFGSDNPPPFTRYRARQVCSNYHFSVEKAKRVLGWKPETDIDTAVEKTIKWFKEEYLRSLGKI
ncbi:MAG: hypothetical protein A2Y33_05485 [Spirochaetes bacterium GWF1_51_8]|nr:MAG: hypothetical protein A2Y33_05485 [Spirochaetes bacterium GWF1_51_8]